jgi:hypothetical protein
MVIFMKANGKLTSSMVEVHLKWETEEYIQGIGPKAKCMVKDSTFGHKGNNMRVLTKTT